MRNASIVYSMQFSLIILAIQIQAPIEASQALTYLCQQSSLKKKEMKKANISYELR